MSGDVQEMFLNVRMREVDKKYHRILVKKENGVWPYEFQVFPFGNPCSASAAVGAAHLAANKMQESHPLAAEAIREDTLIDDTLKSTESVEQLIELKDQLIEVYESIGMNIRKFASNSEVFMKTVPQDKCSPDFDISGILSLIHI